MNTINSVLAEVRPKMVFLEHRPRVYYSYYAYYSYLRLLLLLAFTTLTTAVEATALLFVQQHVKGAIIVYHVTPPHGQIWPLHRMIVRELRQ